VRGRSDTVCDNPDRCDANGVRQPNHEPATTKRPAVGQCDVAESCTADGVCPATDFAPRRRPRDLERRPLRGGLLLGDFQHVR
jgi:hypothetical protein